MAKQIIPEKDNEKQEKKAIESFQSRSESLLNT